MKINPSYNNYFFDFFGTIMNRVCSADDVKRLWANRMSHAMSFAVSSSELYAVRRGAEKQICVKERDNEFTYTELAENMYTRLCCLHSDIGYSQEEFLGLSIKTELSVEKDVQVVNEPVKEWFVKLKSMGKRVFILSDFYLGSDCFAEFLRAKGLDGIAERIFVSCELGTNKASSKIYPLVLSELGLNAQDCCMIGDNHTSDFLNAKAKGLDAVKVKENKKFNQPVDCRKELFSLLTYEKKGGLSYSNYCFLLYLFVQRLYAQLVKNEHARVYFLAREGEFLKKLFDAYCIQMNIRYGTPLIHSKYLYVSRKSTFPATLRPLEQEDFSLLFRSYPNMSIRGFLEHIDLDTDIIEKIKDSLSFDADEDIIGIAHSQQFEELLRNELFIKAYKERITEAKETFNAYLRQNGLFYNSNPALVDVGWRGSIQDYIKASLSEDMSITGYYIGLNNNTSVSEDNRKAGLIFSHYPVSSEDIRVWSFDSNFMERLLSASHPSTKGYVTEGEEVSPVFNEFGSEENNYKLILPVQDYIAEKFSRLTDIIYNLPVLDDTLYSLIKEAHINTCCKVSASDMKLQSQLLKGQNENFGYLVVAGDRLKKVFSAGNIIRKLRGNLGKLRDTSLIARVFMTKGFYGLAAAFYRSNAKALRKDK